MPRSSYRPVYAANSANFPSSSPTKYEGTNFEPKHVAFRVKEESKASSDRQTDLAKTVSVYIDEGGLTILSWIKIIKSIEHSFFFLPEPGYCAIHTMSIDNMNSTQTSLRRAIEPILLQAKVY